MKIKKILIILIWFFSIFFLYNISLAQPSFSQFWNRIEWNTYSINVTSERTLTDNVVRLFSPNNEDWQIWRIIRIIWVWVFLIFLIRAWAIFMLKANDEWEIKKAKMNLVYIIYWWVLFFWVIRILWTALNLWAVQWTQELVWTFQSRLMLQVLWFFKAFAFFMAVVMIFYYGYKMMQALDKEDKIAEARKWVINVLLALILIKVIDFVYYIAQQSDFKSRAWELLVSFSKVLWYVLWWALLISIFYAWFLMITSRWEEESFNKWKNIIKAVFIVAILVMLFLLIVYQVISELT